MKFPFAILLLFIFTSATGQTIPFLRNTAYKVNNHLEIKDEEIFRLMDIINAKTESDSERVDAVYLLDKINCDTCVLFLINHINEMFDYGEGISELDQMNFMACWSVLINRHASWAVNRPDDIVERWRLFSLCLKSLHEFERDEKFLMLLIDIFSRGNSKDMYRVILLDEMKRNKSRFRAKSTIYDVNLSNILRLLN